MRTPGMRKPSQHCHHCGLVQAWPICVTCKKKQAKQKYQNVKESEAERAQTNKYYRSKAWRDLRTFVLNRDYNQCIKCGNQNTLHVHHIKPRKDGGLDEPNNLITLCQACHNIVEAIERNKRL